MRYIAFFMASRMPHVRPSLVVLLLALFAPPVTRVHAQDVTEVTLKSAFLFNFARFTEWPVEALPADLPISVCVIGDRNIADSFTRTVEGKQLLGRPIAATFVGAFAPLPTCHVLYISGIDDRRLAEVVATVRNSPVLTVSDTDAFAKRGGIVQIFVEGGKLKFRINARSARRARLALSSRLLALAEVIDDDVAWLATEPVSKIQTDADAALVSQKPEVASQDRARRSAAWGRH
jgi:hypothetical protein